jgi:tetratricopeptide (TPR) repeat protein
VRRKVFVATLVVASLALTVALARRPAATFLCDLADETRRAEGLKGVPEATKYVEYAVRIDPSHPEAWGRLCYFYELGLKPAEVRLGPCQKQLEIAPTASGYHTVGMLLFNKDNERAAQAFEKSIQLEPSECYSYGYLSDIRKGQGRADESLAVLQRGYAKSKQTYCHLCYGLAHAYFQAERFDEAIEPLECAIKTDKFMELAAPGAMKLMLGYIFEVKGMRREAEKAYREFDKTIPQGAFYSCLPPEGKAFDYKNCRVRKG